MAEARPDFQNVQYEFTAHLRDPDNTPAPSEIEDRRLEIYRGLLYRNVQGFIANGFPVLRKLYEDEPWHAMIRDFFSKHQSHSPYFKDIAKEFIDYLSEERELQLEDPPFLLELADYERLETTLTIVDAKIDWNGINRDGDLMNAAPVLSPTMQLNRYAYPVQKIKPDFQPQTPPEQVTFLLVYRDQADKVGFMEVNPMTARLIDLINEHPEQTGEEILKILAQEIPSVREDVILHGGHTTLTQLREKDIILGTAA